MHPLKEKLNKVEGIVDSDKLKDIVVTSIMPIDKKSYSIRLLNCNDSIESAGEITVNNGSSYQWINMNNRELSEKVAIDGAIDIGRFNKGEVKTLKINI